MAIGREIEDINRALIRHQHDHPPVRDLNKEADRRLNRGQRIGDDFARLIGSWTFVVLQAALAVVWLVLNVLSITNHWDPYPFQLLNLALTLEIAIWLSVTLMAVNRLADRDRLRAQHDYEVDVKAEDEVKALMTHLEVQDEILIQVLHRLDHTDRELRRLARRLGVAPTEEEAS
jgi:uncharacterized membrane protein